MKGGVNGGVIGGANARTATGAPSGEILLLSLGATVVMLFAGFTAAYLIRRAGADWEPLALPAVVWPNTLLLIAGSVAVEVALRRSSRTWLLAALLAGTGFLAGQLVAWQQLVQAGIYLPTTPHGSFFFMLSGVHGLHLVGGVAALVYAWARGRGLRYVARYWHIVGVVWLYVLVLLTAF